MTYKKYIKRDGKTYGPYIYKSRKENGKVITEYLGSATENAKKSEKFSNKSLFLTLGLIFVFLLMIFLINNPQLYSNPEIVYSEKNIQTYSITGNAVLVDLSEKTSNLFSKTKSIITGFVIEEISETSETSEQTTEQVIEIQDDSTPETTEEQEEEQTEEVEGVVEEGQEITETLEETEKEQIKEELNETQETSETEIENSTLSPTPETEVVNETEIITNQTISETNETSIISETNETIIADINETEIIVVEKNLTKLIEEKIQTHQSKAIINKPVKWIKTFDIEDINTTESLNIILPKKANNITIKTGNEVQESLNELQEYNKIINQSKKQEIINQDGKGITGMVSKDVENSKGLLVKLWRKIFSLRMTGYAISELEAQTQELITETQTEKIIDVKEISEKTNETQIAVEYFTDAPEVLEEVYENNNGKLVKVFADDFFNYTNILAYTIVTEKDISINDLNKIRVYHYVSADDFYRELEEQEELTEEVEEEIEEENETTEQEEVVEEVVEQEVSEEINETNESNEGNTQDIIEIPEEVEEEIEEEQEKEEQTEVVIEEQEEIIEETNEAEEQAQETTETQDVFSPETSEQTSETQTSESSEEQSAPITGGVVNNINSQKFKNSVKKIFLLPINFFSKVFSSLSFTGKVVDEEIVEKEIIEENESEVVNEDFDEVNESLIEDFNENLDENNNIINENQTINQTIENETPENETIIHETSENEQITNNETEETITINNQSFVKVQIDFEAFDLDEDGFVDYIEWNVPHLSEQIYEIIYIEKAVHLDENKTFIEDVYDFVKEKDDNLTIVISNEHYLRVTFEEVLDNTKDITIYAGSVCNESIIINGTEVPCEIYEKKKQIDKIRSGL